MPKPHDGESQDDFINRCIPIVIDEGTADNPDQATAICFSIWEQENDKEYNMDKQKVIKYNSTKAEKVDKRVLRFIGSNEKVDRDNEKIKADGWILTNYKKNPVVLVNHKAAELPVAKTKKVWVEDKKLMFDIEFPEADISPQGDTLYKLYKNGYMNATSVGFMPNFDKIKYGERKGEPRVTFQEQELLEISLVSVPANPSALLTNKSMEKAIKDEVIDELELKDLENYLKDYFDEPEKDDLDEKIENNDEKSTKLSDD